MSCCDSEMQYWSDDDEVIYPDICDCICHADEDDCS